MRILTLQGERVNLRELNHKLLKLAQKGKTSRRIAKRCAAAFSLNITAKIFAFAKRFA